MSKEIRKELEVISVQVKIVEHVKYVYACRNCEKQNILRQFHFTDKNSNSITLE
jgi:transposase IS66-like protein